MNVYEMLEDEFRFHDPDCITTVPRNPPMPPLMGMEIRKRYWRRHDRVWGWLWRLYYRLK